jgi:hypothetical protein
MKTNLAKKIALVFFGAVSLFPLGSWAGHAAPDDHAVVSPPPAAAKDADPAVVAVDAPHDEAEDKTLTPADHLRIAADRLHNARKLEREAAHERRLAVTEYREQAAHYRRAAQQEQRKRMHDARLARAYQRLAARSNRRHAYRRRSIVALTTRPPLFVVLPMRFTTVS